ncbi:MAG TPA: 50S ribosomal protein L9 [Dehalococcoidia bacterium]|nr:50S ribosomal protein L9 [Dehalococcoidia bacterium]MDP6273114.1 50S ribosomal protein L9 [Dehalococcoidia bacterium]MDP7161054.1 50S ribosomal protein L9 [Dehalococcoidia bacterium]MDP7213010.1 50S ribosomal protein L9 [Dehalococcoidia bacterium]MDP7514809.1 50S ribosomal protein L9 [Dehalococcoidia bacterium]
MKVIFLQDVPPNARAGDVKDVKNGYARNFLLPRELATLATTGELKRVESLRREAEVRRVKEAEEWREVAAKLAEEPVEILVRSGPRGRLYGSVTNTMLAEKLTEISRVQVDRRGIRFDTPVRMLGEYVVQIRYFEGVDGQVVLNVVSIDGGAEAAAMEAALEEGVSGDGIGEMSLLEEFEARRLAREAREAEEVAGEDDSESSDEFKSDDEAENEKE